MRIRVMLAAAVLTGGVGCGGGAPPEDILNDCGGPTAVDLSRDVANCGACAHECTAVHSTPLCRAGQCTRTPCESGWVDLDPDQPGCESNAAADALPENGVVFWAFPAAGAFGASGLASASYRAEGSLGQSTPAPVGGAVQLQSAHYRNFTGFDAILH